MDVRKKHIGHNKTDRRIARMAAGERVVICGAGPSGLTAAYLLAKEGVHTTVLEGSDTVGGISQTVRYKGYRFDIGGHRFFTKIAPVEALWQELLGDDFLDVPRLSRIHYNGRYFNYPLQATNALRGLGLYNAVRIVFSYLDARLNPQLPEDTFEQWVCNRFGRRLYEVFFKTYTEKVWGIPCTEIRAEWAAQRIQGLSLARAVLTATSLNRRSTDIKSLIHTFRYPRLGPGQMWEKCRDRIRTLGGSVLMQHKVVAFESSDGYITAAKAETPDGPVRIQGDHFISTMSLRSLVRSLGPAGTPEASSAANELAYRDFILVALVLEGSNVFPDNWIYIHTPGVNVGRVQNFNNWSKSMLPDTQHTCLGMEYFCFEGDGLWQSSDDDLIALATRELTQLGLAPGHAIVDGSVVRMPKAYPIYDAGYRANVDLVRECIDAIPNLHTVGRNGMHKYNNQDHSMYTAMLTVANLHGAAHDVWSVNTDFEYHEEQKLGTDERGSAQAPWESYSADARSDATDTDENRGDARLAPAVRKASVIIPARDCADSLRSVLVALVASDLPRSNWELIVVDDSSTDGTASVAREYADVVLTVEGGPRGPAFARNRGAEVARGETLVFIDSDVRVHRDTIRRLVAALEPRAEAPIAVFGSYDAKPDAPGLVSQYRNLLHHYVHRTNGGPATTFWAGCGAVLRSSFTAVGMFDENRFRRPQVEDIELGYRLHDRGGRISLQPDIQATHLKRWTLGRVLKSDFSDRAVPWTRLMLERRSLGREATLNVNLSEKMFAPLAVVALALTLAAIVMHDENYIAAALIALLPVLVGNGRLLAWFAKERGIPFAFGVVPLRLLYYLTSAAGAAWAIALHATRRARRTRVALGEAAS